MSTVAEILERRDHNKRVDRARASTYIQHLWGNLSFLYVEKPRIELCRRCRRSDQIDATEDCIDRWAVLRRRHPMLEPDQIREVVLAGLRAEVAALAKFQGGNRAQG